MHAYMDHNPTSLEFSVRPRRFSRNDMIYIFYIRMHIYTCMHMLIHTCTQNVHHVYRGENSECSAHARMTRYSSSNTMLPAFAIYIIHHDTHVVYNTPSWRQHQRLDRLHGRDCIYSLDHPVCVCACSVCACCVFLSCVCTVCAVCSTCAVFSCFTSACFVCA